MKRSPQLVCQHLENISRHALEKYQDIVQQYVRRRNGVYALYRRNRLYYVGLASNLRKRLRDHLKDRHKDSWDRFSVYLTIGDKHLKELETLILRIVKPSGNHQMGTFPRSENIRRKFAADIRKYQRDELAGLLGGGSIKPAPKKSNKKTDGKKSRTPILGPYIDRAMVLRGRYKHQGKLIKARVRRNGQIYFGGEVFNSPSLAAARACQRRTCNGWTFWEFERSKGEWILLDELRQ